MTVGKGRALDNQFSTFKVSAKMLLQVPVASFQMLCPGGTVSKTAFLFSYGHFCRIQVREHRLVATERRG